MLPIISDKCWGLDVVDASKIILQFPNSGRFEIIGTREKIATKKIPVPGQYILYVSWFADII